MDQIENNRESFNIEEDEIDLLELLGVLLRYKWKIFFVTLAAAMGVLIFSIISLVLPPEKSYLPNLYSSTTKLLINDDSSGSMLPSNLSGLASMAGISVGGSSSYGNLAVDLAGSNPIIDILVNEFDIIVRYDIKKYPQYSSRAELRERLSVNLDEDTQILSISYLDWDPVFSQGIVNRIVDLLDDRFASIGVNRNLNQKTLLEENLARVNNEIISLEAEVKVFQEEYGVLNLEQLATIQISSLAELKSQLILKELEIKTYTQFSRVDDPVVNRMKSERNNLETFIRQIEQGEDQNGYSQTGPSMKELPTLALEFSHLQRELLVQAEIYKILTQEYEMVKLKVEGEGPIFQVLELGGVADKKSKPGRGMISIAVTMAAFFMAIILVFIHNAWVNIKNDPERMSKLKG